MWIEDVVAPLGTLVPASAEVDLLFVRKLLAESHVMWIEDVVAPFGTLVPASAEVDLPFARKLLAESHAKREHLDFDRGQTLCRCDGLSCSWISGAHRKHAMLLIAMPIFPSSTIAYAYTHHGMPCVSQ